MRFIWPKHTPTTATILLQSSSIAVASKDQQTMNEHGMLKLHMRLLTLNWIGNFISKFH